MKRIRRIPALAAALLLVFSLSGCSELKTAWEQQQFDTFINNVLSVRWRAITRPHMSICAIRRNSA